MIKFKDLLIAPPTIFSYVVIPHIIAFLIFDTKYYLNVYLDVLAGIFFLLFLIFVIFSMYYFIKFRIDPSPWKNNSQKLFTSGLYKVSRNPLYVSLLFLLISIGLLTMPFLLIVTIPLLVLLLNIIIKNEEKFLRKFYQEEYVEYFNRTPRWILFK